MNKLLPTILLLLATTPLFAQVSAINALRSQPAVVSADIPSFVAPAPELYNSPLKADYSGEQLFTYLHDATVPAPRKQEPSYSASKSYMYATADNTGCNGRPGLITFYSQVCVPGSGGNGNSYKEQGDQNNDGVVDGFVNAEHLWPQSFFGKSLPMVADLHHLQSTFVTPNGRRGSYKFGVVARPSYATSAGSKLGSGMFEPANAVKGNVARALLYFVVRYYDKNIRQGMNYNDFWTNNVPMLLEWNRQDPPDANERRRNDLIEQFQGNRNPFVDNPELADRIGAAVFQAH